MLIQFYCFSMNCSLFTISVIKLRNDRVPMMQQQQHRPRQAYINITVHDRLFSCFAFYLIEYHCQAGDKRRNQSAAGFMVTYLQMQSTNYRNLLNLIRVCFLALSFPINSLTYISLHKKCFNFHAKAIFGTKISLVIIPFTCY